MTKRQRTLAVKAMAADVRRSLEKYDNVSISPLNYGLKPSYELAADLSPLLPGVDINPNYGFMGYVHFEKKCGAELPDGGKCDLLAGHVASNDTLVQLHGIRGGVPSGR